MLKQILESVAGGRQDGKKIKGRLVLMKKNVLDFNDFHANILDGVHELFGHKVSLQLVSSVHRDHQGKLSPLSIIAYMVSENYFPFTLLYLCMAMFIHSGRIE